MKDNWKVPAELAGIWERLARFEPARSAGGSHRVQFLQMAMAYAREEELQQIRRHFTREEFQEALRQAPAGLFDRQSWRYWHEVLAMGPTPPLPRRPFVPEGMEQDDRFSKCVLRAAGGVPVGPSSKPGPGVSLR
jgi:hypothetical protein